MGNLMETLKLTAQSLYCEKVENLTPAQLHMALGKVLHTYVLQHDGIIMRSIMMTHLVAEILASVGCMHIECCKFSAGFLSVGGTLFLLGQSSCKSIAFPFDIAVPTDVLGFRIVFGTVGIHAELAVGHIQAYNVKII